MDPQPLPVNQAPVNPVNSFVPPTSTSNSNSNSKMIIFVVILVIVVIGLLAVIGIMTSNIAKKKETTNTNEMATTNQKTNILPTYSAPATATPTGTKTAGKQFNTMEEALSFALTGSGIEHVDTTKIQEIKLLYTPTYKTWKFYFVTRTNGHQSPTTFATVYDETSVTVYIKNTGEFSVDTGLTSHDKKEDSAWLYYPKPSEVAISSYLDIAKQKIIAAGATPGTITSADFYSTGYSSDTLKQYNSQWKIAIVLAGEETKTEKKSKTVKFLSGNYSEMYDSTVTIY